MTELELRAKIRGLMASGALPSEPPRFAQRWAGDEKSRLPGPCSVCGEVDPQIYLFYDAGGRWVRLHAACNALWEQERGL